MDNIINNNDMLVDFTQKPLKKPTDGRPFGPDIDWWNDGWMVIGIDEAGRGPLAGPVVAGAVIFGPEIRIDGIADSKKLSPNRRAELDREIRERATAYGIGEVDVETIDRINILQATRLAMEKAANSALKMRKDRNGKNENPVGLFVDGRIPPIGIGRQVNIVKGDDKSFSIGAASIIAKVYRDNLMILMENEYPGYSFAKNKGYGTAQHIDAIKKLGYCPIHRRSFHLRALDTGETK